MCVGVPTTPHTMNLWVIAAQGFEFTLSVKRLRIEAHDCVSSDTTPATRRRQLSACRTARSSMTGPCTAVCHTLLYLSSCFALLRSVRKRCTGI